jgi:hypothetical protein
VTTKPDADVAVVVIDGEETLACVVVNSAPGNRNGVEISTSVNGLSKGMMAHIFRDLARQWEQDAAVDTIHG